MPHVRFNESFTPTHPPKNVRPYQQNIDDEGATRLDRAIAPFSSSSSEHDHSQNPTMQHISSSRSSTLQGNSPDTQSAHTLNGHCAKCNHPFGRIVNQFDKVTGSYYLLVDESQYSRIDLKAEGERKELGQKTNALEGCIVQGLACNSCSDRFAFQCVESPSEKHFFRHRLFFKLDRINLVNKDNGAVERATVVNSASRGQITPITPTGKREDTLSPEPAQPANMPSVEHPDYEAARNIMAKEAWSTVHSRWESRTREQLSPSSFGKRILPVVHEIQNGQKRDYRSHSRESSEVRPIANGRSIPQANGVIQAENTRPRYADTMESQRADINRIDATLANVQAEISQMKLLMAELRYEIQSGAPRTTAHGEDASTLDSLSDAVRRIASRSGEIDGMRFELTTMSRKLKRMEETQGIPTTPSQASQSFPRSEPSLQPPPPSSQHHQELAPRGWNAVNTNKRKSFDAGSSFDVNKRPRTDYRTISAEGASSYAPHVAPAPAPPPSAGPAVAPAPVPPPQQAPTLAPIRSNSEESAWHPDSHRLPPIRGMHQGGRGSARPPAPPRLQPTPEMSTPAWERDSWDQSRVDVDGYYRPLGGGHGAAPLSPGSAKRGNLIRRGTSSGSAPLQYIDPTPAKRTRQRPVRNEHGILIRKDGKPDQRSISSPQNLRKVHERRMQEQEKGSQGSPEDPSSPADTDAPRSALDGPNSALESSGSDSPAMEQASPIEAPDSRPASRPESNHDRMMHKVFPHGVEEGARRMNHASHIFEPGSQEHHEAQLRKDMEKEEAHARDGEYDDRMEVDGTQDGEAASGSLYRPPTQSTTQDESRQAVIPDSVDPSSKTTTSVNESSTAQDSDNRPLRVRELADDQQQASGSVYEPSPTEEKSTA